MRISAVEVRDFKRISHVRIDPGDRALVLVAGRNRQGKSSLLDALSVAFAGKRGAPDKPVREGAERAEIRVELDGGALVIRRRISATGAHQLEVSDAGGGRTKPQQILDKLRGQLLDPLQFLRLSPKEQRETLLRVVDVGIDLDAWEVGYRRTFDDRTEVGRDVRRLEGELAGLPAPEAVERVDVAALEQRLVDIGERARAGDHLRSQVEQAAKEVTSCAYDVDSSAETVAVLEAELARARKLLAERQENHRRAEAALATAEAALDTHEGPTPEEVAEVRAQLRAGQEQNERAARAAAAAERRAVVERDLKSAKGKQEVLTGKLAEMQAARAAALEAAEMPVPGLDVGDGEILLNGQPFSQASGAEQLATSLAIAMALSPEVRDVWIKDGALLDDDSLALVRRLAEERGYRVWLERVGDRDEGALIIEDGGVVGAEKVEAAS